MQQQLHQQQQQQHNATCKILYFIVTNKDIEVTYKHELLLFDVDNKTGLKQTIT